MKKHSPGPKRKGVDDKVVSSAVDFFDKKYSDCQPDGQNAWWTQSENGQVCFTNLPNVLPCICGDHPFTVTPPMLKREGGYAREYLHCGLPRSGSTVVWQIMNEVVPNKIIRSHEFYDVCPLLYSFKKIVCCVRHPYDVYSSLLRTATKSSPGQVEKEFEKYMNEMKKWLFLEKLKMSFSTMISGVPDVLYVKYEDFYGRDRERVDYVLNYLESDLADREKDHIAQKFTVSKNIERASDLSGFEEVDADSQIHGNHVGEKKGKVFASSLDEETKQKIQETYEWFFGIFNYTHY